MSNHSIREFMVMMNRLEVPAKGGWIMVNAVEGVLKPALSSNWCGRPPAISPQASVARNTDPFAKAGLQPSLRASRYPEARRESMPLAAAVLGPCRILWSQG